MRTGIFTFILILTYLFFKDVFQSISTESSLLYIGLMLVFMMPLVAIGSRLKAKDRLVEQQLRSEKIISSLDEIGILTDSNRKTELSTDCPNTDTTNAFSSLVLFLRPFASDQVEVSNPELSSSAASWIPLYKFLLPSTVKIDDGLKYALPKESKFVAISSAVDSVGAVKIKRSDDNWQQAFDSLAPTAKYIIIVPGVRDGTKWEIKMLVNLGLTSRCLFIFFPLPRMIKFEASEAFEFESVKCMLAEYGLHVPEKSPVGDPISIGDAVVFDRNGEIGVHGSKVVVQNLLSCELNISRIKSCLKIIQEK